MSTSNPFVKTSIEKSVQDLPALPGVVTRILKETEDPDTCAQTIERMIGTEPALASKVLRVVNSAYYGLSGQVTSLAQATVILGLQQVRNLVLSVGAFSTMKPKTPRQNQMMEAFWLHSFGTAAATQCIAQQKKLSITETETAFVGGLLHDIGRLFLFSNFTQTYDQVILYADQKKVQVESAEKKLLGLTHSDVGSQMAQHWKLPKVLTRIIGKHEGPFDADAPDPMVYSVHIGDWLTKGLYFEEGQVPVKDLPAVILNWLSFTPEEVDQLRRDTEQKIEDAKEMYGLLAA